ncbi:pyrophosphate--fructose 6-phosphate 1-phosphotransferase subunit alpha-like [Panicum miliaceum]|uniref:Pyrophosphate--fructose 6-phosphate 1-phosphotransferase subunit alpha-like n=1 Tax=Panicum miliaceum TaxID=4540 RepID=A0A3L6QSR9_PANMI|nr:pyrophosphate--fructose 6-phosphate 1-phosphotransferase subunit alpha-like [Panicum miliaceum]
MNADLGSPRELTGLQRRRALYQPDLPPCLQGTRVRVELGDSTTSVDPKCADIVAQAFPHTFGQKLVHFLEPNMMVSDAQVLEEHPPIRVGVLFSGRQSPGGHNVIWGTYDAMKAQNPHNVLLGFVGGTEGLFAKKTLEITDDVLLSYKNQGGFDFLGRTVDQIRTTEQVNAAMSTCCDLSLDGLIIIGGVTSNSDAAQLAETFATHNCKTKVWSHYSQTSSDPYLAIRNKFSESTQILQVIGVPVTLSGDLKNQFVETTVGFDTVCKVNSQLISNVCLDAVSAGKVILGEEVALSKLTLMEITNKICEGVEARAAQGKYHGVLLIPEGLIESIPEMYALIQEINNLHSNNVPEDEIPSQLSPWAAALFKFMPPFIRREIDTEQLLAHLVEAEMNKRTKEGNYYKGRIFSSVCHFFGSQARGSLPSNFDCNYAYAMMSVRRHLRGPGAVPIGRPAIHPSPIDLKAESYGVLREKASSFLLDDFYRTPGGIQFEGPGADTKPITLTIEGQDYLGDIEILQDYLEKVRIILKPGCSREILKAAISSMASVNDVLKVMSAPLNAELPLYHFN